jgi:DNA repair protein RadB
VKDTSFLWISYLKIIGLTIDMANPTGSTVLDDLSGGYVAGHLNTIYGPAATGKTTACLLAAIECAKKGKKVIFIDTEGGFSVERLSQLTENYETVLENIVLLRIKTFEDQVEKFLQLNDILSAPNIGLVIVDTIGIHYRAARAEAEDYRTINTQLASMVDVLRNISKREDIIVLMTEQVHSSMDNKNSVAVVGGNIISNRSKCMIQLKTLSCNRRCAILEKHPEIDDKKQVVYEIVTNGFNKYNPEQNIIINRI